MSIAVDLFAKRGAFTLGVKFTSGADGVTTLFGPSGAGKTTIINMIAGLETPDRGRIAIDDFVLTDTEKRQHVPVQKRGIGYVFQDARLFPHMNVATNLDYGGKRTVAGIDPAARDAIIAMLDIGHLLPRMPGTLSGGERQRIAIGRALLMKPRLLLLDEPMASLDNARKSDIMRYLERLRAEAGVPIIHVSHAVDEVARLADEIILIDGGKVVTQGATAHILTRLDLFPLTGRFEAGAIVEGLASEFDEDTRLTTVSFEGGTLKTTARLPKGKKVRLRIRARDVMLSLEPLTSITANNVLPVTVLDFREEDGPYLDVQLQCGAAIILARITHASRQRFGIEPGRALYAIIKATSVER